jgi:rare lipoprotein A
VKITNLENNRSVIALVNDYGPSPEYFPERVADLSSYAFGKIASLGEGIINVKVEPYHESPNV